MADPTARGINSNLIIADSDAGAWGDMPAAPAGFRMPLLRFNGDWLSRNLIATNILCGNRNPTKPVRGNVTVNGGWVQALEFSSIGHVLKHAFGAPATTGAGPYDHVFKTGHDGATPSTSLGDGFVAEHQYPDLTTPAYLRFLGNKIESLGFSVAPEGVVEVEVSCMGKGEDPAGTASPMDATPTEYDCTAIDHFVGTVKEGGVAIGNITQANFTIANNLEGQYVVGGQGEIGELPEGIVGVTGSITVLFRDLALYTKAKALTETELEFGWVVDASNSLVFNFPEVLLELTVPEVSGPAGVLQTIPFQAYYEDGADAAAAIATLTNSVASY